MPVSMSSALARPSCSTKIASLIIGTRMRLTTKPGLLRAVTGDLPTTFANSSAVAWVVSSVCRPRISSSRPITGTGLKKCMPMKRPGLSSTAASCVIEIDEVFVAMLPSRSASAASTMASIWRRMRSLSFQVLGGRLDHQVAAGQRVLAGHALDAGQHRGLGLGRQLVLADQPLQAVADGLQAALHRRVVDVDHRDLQSAHGADLRDAVAHGAGADDADPCNAHDRAPAGLLIDPATGHGEKRPGTSAPGGPAPEHPAALEAARAALTDPADAPAALYYTSGTTGSPKGVVHTHRTLIADSLQSPPAWEYDFDGVRALAVTPLFHIAAHTIFLPVLAIGGTLAIDTYRTDDTIALIEALDINSFFGVPSILLMMADRARALGTTLPGVRSLQFGAAPMPVAKLAQVRELFTEASFVHGMGQTESGGTLVTLPGTLAFERAGSVGFAMAGVEIAIFDETDHEVAHGNVGELVARGPNVMREYFRNARASADTLRGGWLHTGDLGYRDADGLVYLVDRKKDMIIRGGENIYSTEVEQILMRHPAVAQAAVIGTPDPLFGEQVTAFIVLHPEAAPLTLAQVQSHCRGLLAGYKVPAELHVVDVMPSTATGKVQKGELRALASSR
jgi:acyl-CoA synthetase (AMP-forming)/AMP-acid ligase II